MPGISVTASFHGPRVRPLEAENERTIVLGRLLHRLYPGVIQGLAEAVDDSRNLPGVLESFYSRTIVRFFLDIEPGEDPYQTLNAREMCNMARRVRRLIDTRFADWDQGDERRETLFHSVIEAGQLPLLIGLLDSISREGFVEGLKYAWTIVIMMFYMF